jgi:hypothetical protein
VFGVTVNVLNPVDLPRMGFYSVFSNFSLPVNAPSVHKILVADGAPIAIKELRLLLPESSKKTPERCENPWFLARSIGRRPTTAPIFKKYPPDAEIELSAYISVG